MTRSQPKSSLTDRHAEMVAAAIAKGRWPAQTSHLDQYFESSPHEIFTALDGVARHMPPAGNDATLALGYLFLLEGLLERVRYRSDRGYPDARRLIADFQAKVAAQVKAERIDGYTLAHVAGALHRAKIPALPKLAAVSAKPRVNDNASGHRPTDFRVALAKVVEASDGDPFILIESLTESLHALPVETRAAVASDLALSGLSDARGAAVLFLLDPTPMVRQMVASALASVASMLSPIDVRRLIAVRNWRSENERPEIDSIVRKARAAGVDCAQWETGSAEKVLATAIDGATAQGLLLVSPVGRKKRLSSILTKAGLEDAWSGEPESRREIEATIADSRLHTVLLPVSRSYLDSVLAHHLALSIEKGESAPLGLLQVAETIGGADWQPVRYNISDALARLIAELPEPMRGGTTIETILRDSNELADLEAIAETWFEDDPEIEQLIADAGGCNRAKLATYLLQSVMARHRDKWAELFLRSALWMREAPAEFDVCWRELAIVAKAVSDGRDLSEIGLMRDIADRTIAVFTDEAPI
jgi:hypothetical protein